MTMIEINSESGPVLPNILNAKRVFSVTTGICPTEIRLGEVAINLLKKELDEILGIKHPYTLTEICGMKIVSKRGENEKNKD